MTATLSTEELLSAALDADPGNHLLRYALADCLEESAGAVECAVCSVRWGWTVLARSRHLRHLLRHRWGRVRVHLHGLRRGRATAPAGREVRPLLRHRAGERRAAGASRGVSGAGPTGAGARL